MSPFASLPTCGGLCLAPSGQQAPSGGEGWESTHVNIVHRWAEGSRIGSWSGEAPGPLAGTGLTSDAFNGLFLFGGS